jgi:hypothetical protein
MSLYLDIISNFISIAIGFVKKENNSTPRLNEKSNNYQVTCFKVNVIRYFRGVIQSLIIVEFDLNRIREIKNLRF